ncbi:MAG: hypothetical protein JNJ54_01290 [Myxococcaceae bacterium]|nr:hypothetical protein [Myxococcaceae bacterium]
MSSEIRALLASAQQAEATGDVEQAVLHLQQAADFYRARNLGRRAAQMERHIARLEGRPVLAPSDPGDLLEGLEEGSVDDDELDDDGLGFGDELLDGPARRGEGVRSTSFDRGAQRADPAIDAWCSFCCRPKGEVGALVAGPAGAYVCAGCVSTAAKLLGTPIAELPVPAPTASRRPAALRHQLPSQSKAKTIWDRRLPKVALVLGPEGAGKTTFLESLGQPIARPLSRLPDTDTLLVDLNTPLTPEDEAALQAWLDAHPKRRAVLAARGDAPRPVLVLQGEHGEEPVYDTNSLSQAVASHLSPGLLSKVDAVLPLPTPDHEALLHLAKSLLAARDIELPADALESIVALAERSGRGARELAALIARIPAGRYKTP